MSQVLWYSCNSAHRAQVGGPSAASPFLNLPPCYRNCSTPGLERSGESWGCLFFFFLSPFSCPLSCFCFSCSALQSAIFTSSSSFSLKTASHIPTCQFALPAQALWGPEMSPVTSGDVDGKEKHTTHTKQRGQTSSVPSGRWEPEDRPKPEGPNMSPEGNRVSNRSLDFAVFKFPRKYTPLVLKQLPKTGICSTN